MVLVCDFQESERLMDYPDTHPVTFLRERLDAHEIPPTIREAVERLINMWEALDAQTRGEQVTAQATITPCIRCELVQKLFPIAEPAPLDATTVKRWIDENFK